MTHFDGEIKHLCWTRSCLESLITARLRCKEPMIRQGPERDVVPSPEGSSALLMMVGASRAGSVFLLLLFFARFFFSPSLQQQFSSSKQH